MAAANYTTDLTPIIDQGTGNNTNFSLVTDGGGGQNSIDQADVDDFIEGSTCASRNPFSSSTRGILYDNGSAVTVAAGDAVYIWAKADVAQAIDTKALGGVQLIIGNSANTKSRWYADGRDTYQIGGWKCYPIDPTVTPSTGSHTATTIFGCMWSIPASGPSKGNPFKLDAIRYGRALLMTDGDLANGYATFSGAAAVDNSTSNQWGQLRFDNGVYTVQGLMQLGSTAGNAVDFRDANKAVFVSATDFVRNTFNGIEVQNGASRADFTSINITALGTTSRGYFEAVDDADINIESCSFTSMDTFIFQSQSSINRSTFRDCNQITLAQGTSFTDSTVDSSRANYFLGEYALTTPIGNIGANVTGNTFIRNGSNPTPAIEITGTATSFNLTNTTFTGYTAGSTGTNVATSGTPTGEAIFVNIASGTVTINVDNSTVPSVISAGAQVNVVSGQATLTITNVVTDSDVVIFDRGTTTKLQDDQDIAGTTSAYTYTYAPSTFVDIKVYRTGYEPYYVYGFELGSANASLPVAQEVDRNFVP